MEAAGGKDAVIASYEALNRRDIDAALDALAEDAEWHESDVLPDTGVYRGREAIRAFLADFLGSWERFHQTVEEVRQEGDRVLVMIHLEATGRGSTADVDARYAHLWTVSGTRGVRVDAFYDRAEALAALNP
ncbi:MAG TPA: nuclear transport factor 2 family protein [Solirubrobacterales bacterium]|nr:nuclear transport factor 2 family protein [Solirubrobacterales bacterium]